MILGAPLSKVRKQVELGMFATAAITQIIWMNSYWNDNKYTMLTIVSLIWCYILIGMLARKESLQRFGLFKGDDELDDGRDERDEEDEDDARRRRGVTHGQRFRESAHGCSSAV